MVFLRTVLFCAFFPSPSVWQRKWSSFQFDSKVKIYSQQQLNSIPTVSTNFSFGRSLARSGWLPMMMIRTTTTTKHTLIAFHFLIEVVWFNASSSLQCIHHPRTFYTFKGLAFKQTDTELLFKYTRLSETPRYSLTAGGRPERLSQAFLLQEKPCNVLFEARNNTVGWLEIVSWEEELNGFCQNHRPCFHVSLTFKGILIVKIINIFLWIGRMSRELSGKI